jgi:hypothetical protein
MRKAWDWLQRKWARGTGWVWFYFIAVSHLVNGLDWQDAKGEAAELMAELNQQRYLAWLEAEHVRKAKVRKAQAEFAEEIERELIPEAQEKLRKGEVNIEGFLAEVPKTRKELLESGVFIWQLDDAITKFEKMLIEARDKGPGQAKVA